MKRSLDDDLGARVRAARSYAKLSQKDLGDALGLSRIVIAAIEDNEERHELTLAEARTIARLTGVPVSFLLNGWAAPEGLEDRVAALEEAARQSVEDRNDLAEQITSIASALETRLATFATQVLHERSRRRRRSDRPGEADPPAP